MCWPNARFEKFGGSERDGVVESRTLVLEWDPGEGGRFASYPYRLTIANGPGLRTATGAVQPKGEPTSKQSMRLPEADLMKIMLAVQAYIQAYEAAHHHRLVAAKAARAARQDWPSAAANGNQRCRPPARRGCPPCRERQRLRRRSTSERPAPSPAADRAARRARVAPDPPTAPTRPAACAAPAQANRCGARRARPQPQMRRERGPGRRARPGLDGPRRPPDPVAVCRSRPRPQLAPATPRADPSRPASGCRTHDGHPPGDHHSRPALPVFDRRLGYRE